LATPVRSTVEGGRAEYAGTSGRVIEKYAAANAEARQNASQRHAAVFQITIWSRPAGVGSAAAGAAAAIHTPPRCLLMRA